MHGRALSLNDFIVQLSNVEQESESKLTRHHACDDFFAIDSKDVGTICDEILKRSGKLLLRIEFALEFLKLRPQSLHLDALLKQSSDSSQQD